MRFGTYDQTDRCYNIPMSPYDAHAIDCCCMANDICGDHWTELS